MADAAVTVTIFLIEKALSFLKEELSREAKVLDDVNKIKGHLKMMQALLQDAEGCEGTSQTMKTLVNQIRDLAHEMEDVLDEFMIHAPRSFSTIPFLQQGYQLCHDAKHRTPVQQIQSNIAKIQESMSAIKISPEFGLLLRKVHTGQSSNVQPYREEAQIIEEDEIMGIDKPRDSLLNLLNESSGQCNTISVVGPCGAGKTVLVTSVYNSKRVIGQFDCHAWLSLTPNQNHEQRLKNLLSQFSMGLLSPIGADTAMKLTNYLWDKRYIVVLDGVRKEEEWAFIKSKLPDPFNGSRIILTTQYSEIAEKCTRVLRIDGLEYEDSWKLFCKKAYGNDSGDCPPDLQCWSEMIVKRCEGLPQPISELGTLLSRRPREQAEWKHVHDNLVTEMQGNSNKTMFLTSYYDLPSIQKSCLLYFSIFPEDSSIKRERLIRLWLSEGFVEKCGSVALEKTAEDFLNELVSRNLVHACSRDFRGRVKSCRVLNLMREFICHKSKDKLFAQAVTDSKVIARRLSIENASSGLKSTKDLQLTSVRSVFMFGLDKASSKMIGETLQRMRLLKVLDLESAPLESFPECVVDVALLLRYLSLRNTNVNMVPKKIKRLRYLEYLDLKQTQVTKLPEEIYSLQDLQHLLVHRCDPLTNELQGVEIVGKMEVLPSIRKLSIIKVDHSPRFFQVLGQLTQLRKLGLVDLRENDGRLLCPLIKNMPHLSTLNVASSTRETNLNLSNMGVGPAFLKHLYLKGRLTICPTWILSLNSLVKLMLKWSKLSVSPIDSLQQLPNLMELEMIDAFTGEALLFEEGGFPNLRTLRIEEFVGLDMIILLDGSMPVLWKLTIVRCKRLLELPVGIEGLASLEELLLYDMDKKFTSRLGRTSEDRPRINHIPVIHSFDVSSNGKWEIQNFSSRVTDNYDQLVIAS